MPFICFILHSSSYASYYNSSTNCTPINHLSAPIVGNFHVVGISGLLTVRIANACGSGVNKPIRKPMKAWQLNPWGSTSNQNRNSDVGDNQGQRWWSQNLPSSRTNLINDIHVEKRLKKVQERKPVDTKYFLTSFNTFILCMANKNNNNNNAFYHSLIKKPPWCWKTCQTHLASVTRVYKYLLSKQWFYNVSGPIPRNKIGKHTQENIFLIKIPKILRVFAQDVPYGMKGYVLWKRRLVNDLSVSAT